MSIPAEIRHLAAAHGPIIPTRVLDAVGFSEWHRRRYREQGHLVSLGKGLYQLPPAETGIPPWELQRGRHLALARAIMPTLPGAYLAGPSAALAHGLPLLDIPEQLHVSRRPRLRTTTSLLRVSRPWHDTAGLVGNLPCAPAAAAVVEMAAHDLRAALVPADAAQARDLLGDLTAVVHQWGSRVGSARVRQLLDLVDGRSGSPLETLARWNFHVLGVPVVPQFIVRDRAGEFIAEADFRVEGHRLLVEVDGRSKYSTGDVLYREKLRQEQIEDLDWGVLRMDNRDISNEHRFRTRLFTAMYRY